MRMTPAYPEASAKAPCTRMTVGVVAMRHSFPCSIGPSSSVPLCIGDDITRSSDFRQSARRGLPPFEPVCILGIKPFQRASRLRRNNAHRLPLRPGAAGRSVRTASARRATPIAAATSSRSARRLPSAVIRVAVDAMGGDRGPEEIVAGALGAASDAVTPIVLTACKSRPPAIREA